MSTLCVDAHEAGLLMRVSRGRFNTTVLLLANIAPHRNSMCTHVPVYWCVGCSLCGVYLVISLADSSAITASQYQTGITLSCITVLVSCTPELNML